MLAERPGRPARRDITQRGPPAQAWVGRARKAGVTAPFRRGTPHMVRRSRTTSSVVRSPRIQARGAGLRFTRVGVKTTRSRSAEAACLNRSHTSKRPAAASNSGQHLVHAAAGLERGGRARADVEDELQRLAPSAPPPCAAAAAGGAGRAAGQDHAHLDEQPLQVQRLGQQGSFLGHAAGSGCAVTTSDEASPEDAFARSRASASPRRSGPACRSR